MAYQPELSNTGLTVALSGRGVEVKVIPLTLKEANQLVSQWHRHHKPVVGCRFCIGAANGLDLVGAAICGRPISRMVCHQSVLEVTRLVTNGNPNACSFLYGACARIAKEMGFQKIQTYVLEEELGTSLKAAGWKFEALTGGGNWNHPGRKGRRTDQPLGRKQRWSRVLR